ncbi:MAG: PD40 domain-containing protein [Candidatus Latescibacterota bacterium]|nr:MAG: PD40 domain-containing protein [Candidatus Latescibacterota bacterium]
MMRELGAMILARRLRRLSGRLNAAISVFERVVPKIVKVLLFGTVYATLTAGGDSFHVRAGEGFDYPRPSGKFKIGTSYLFLEDSTRLDTFSDASGDYRWISIRVWYPASPRSGVTPVPYGNDEFNRSMVEKGIFDPAFLGEVALRPSASFKDVPLASQGAPWPILIYSSSGVITANVFLCEELASHGYVVLAVGHPYWCEFYFDAEGELFYFDKSNRHYTAMWEEEEAKPTKDTKERITRATDGEKKLALYKKLNQIMPTEVSDLVLWQEDIDFLIDRLIELNSREGIYRGRLDTERIGIMGYSKGGALAGQVCATSDRVRAGVNFDGFMFGGVVDNDLAKPFMIFGQIVSWCQECPSINLPFFQRAEADAYLVEIADANHATFTDLPLMREYILPEGILSSLDGTKSALIIRSYVLAFFDTYVKGLSRAPLLDEMPSPFEEVKFMKRTRLVLDRNALKDDCPVLKGPYLGQKPPGVIPEIFAPGIISTEDHEFSITFSKNGNELLFTRRKDSQRGNRLLHMRIEGGRWSAPQPPPFSLDCREFEPNFTPDGTRLFFCSSRALPENVNSPHPFNLWMVSKQGSYWNKPDVIGSPIMEQFPMFATQTKNGTLYFTGNIDRGIYCAVYKSGRFEIPERLPETINSLNSAGHPFVDPDERFIIFDSNVDEEGTKNLYISFIDNNGEWSEPQNINECAGFPEHAAMPHVSFDGEYLFFSGGGDIYWVDAKIIEELRPKE